MACSSPEGESRKTTLAEEFRRARTEAGRRRLAIAAGFCGALAIFGVIGLIGSSNAGVGRNQVVGYAAPNPIAALFQGLFGRPIRSAPPRAVVMPITGGPRANAHIQRPKRVGPKRDLAHATRPQQPAIGRNRLVCVRLCDGYFFPAPIHARGELGDAACAAQCPGAPTRLYSMRGDSVMTAVAVGDRTAYAKLPVALQYTKNAEATCSCGSVDPRSAISLDRTLRQGDRFMTAAGFIIYEGRSGGAADFTPLPHARGVSPQERRLLDAMERASGVPRNPLTAQSQADHLATASTKRIATQ